MLRYWLIIFATIILSACESLITEIPPSELPDIRSKLVVQSFISPKNEYILVVVTESSPVYIENVGYDRVIKNATVRLSDGAHELIIPFDEDSQLYSIKQDTFDIVPGKTYNLNVTDGARTVTASCTVPLSAPQPKSFTIDTALNGNADTVLTFKMNWTDLPGQTNYYRMRASADIEYSIPDGTDPANFKELRVQDRYNFSWDDSFGRDNFQSDANLDGTVFTSPTGRVTLPKVVVFNHGFGKSYTVYPKSRVMALNMEIYNTDEHYYKYHKSLEANRNGDNPFVEPSLVYSNIQGGLGCFAAYHVGQLTFRPN